MGWADCGTDSNGRPIGYAFAATCDHQGCEAKIDRGLGYACGGEHGEGEHYCELYFCASHLFITSIGQLCPACYDRYMVWVCQDLRCKEGVVGTLTEASGERVRLCAEHGKLWAMGEGCSYAPDLPIRIAKEGNTWDIVDGWAEVRRAQEDGAERVQATDRASGQTVWLIFTEGAGFQVEPVEVGV